MKTITLRNIPPDIYQAIKSLAKRNRRSIQQQVISLLDIARIYSGESPIVVAKRLRESLSQSKGREFGDTISEVREDRER